MTDQIGVMVVKAVPIDRDAAVSLVKAFCEWAAREGLDVRGEVLGSDRGAFDLASKFIGRYVSLKPGEPVTGQ